jgi:hypothetical protein
MSREDGWYRVNTNDPGYSSHPNLWTLGWWNSHTQRIIVNNHGNHGYLESEVAEIDNERIDPMPARLKTESI